MSGSKESIALVITRLGLAVLLLSLRSTAVLAETPPAPAPTRVAERPALADGLAVTVQVEAERGGQTDPFAGGRITASYGGGGAGFIFDADGLIATNAHVVAGARSLAVRLHNGRRLPARLLGVDTVLDLAVLRIEAGAPLPAASLGDSRLAREGDPVWAIGAPLGYAFSVSSGVLSGRDRFYDDTYPVLLLQHDAALNPGSSGGPLFDAQGRVIGINTATPPETLFDIGVGFAIPAELAGPALVRLARDGGISRGQLGVSVTAADADVAAVLGADRPGLVVDGLADTGAARRAGLAAGDLMVSLDGAPLVTPGDLTRALLDSRVGQIVRLGYVRAGQPRSARVRLDDPATASYAPATVDAPDAPLDPGMTLGLSEWDAGVSVQAVRPGGPAALYGLRPGDRLRAVNGQAPTSARDALALLRTGTARVALLRIEHGAGPARHVVLPLTRSAAADRPPGRVADTAFGPF